MTKLPGQPSVVETTIDRVSAMTLIIPIKQELVQPLTVTVDHNGTPVLGMGDGPFVRPVENLVLAFEAVKELVATRTPMGLNQVATIHFARWVVINEGSDLLFCANYDTSLDQYLSDFMIIANTKHAPYMDMIWGNCVDYPGSEPTTFIKWARSWLVPTTLFFPSIPDVTVRDIAWLRKFKHLFDEFDEFAQEVPAETWPAELREKYEKLKRDANQIDLAVVL